MLGVVLLLAAPAFAQTKTLAGETITKTAAVEAIGYGTRELAVKGPRGMRDLRRFTRGEADSVDKSRTTAIAGRGPGCPGWPAGRRPSSAAAVLLVGECVARRWTAPMPLTILRGSIPGTSITGAVGNWTYSSARSRSAQALAKVKVGAKVDMHLDGRRCSVADRAGRRGRSAGEMRGGAGRPRRGPTVRSSWRCRCSFLGLVASSCSACSTGRARALAARRRAGRRWRGPNRRRPSARARYAPERWSPTEHIAWKTGSPARATRRPARLG
ncbi:MAG: hypothetical protein MZU95_01150 [Desulfomicrobium escambiense]|nr:hypothetical protein [Desulfomicrobium escambiense]